LPNHKYIKNQKGNTKLAINRYELINKHNPVLHKADYTSPLTVGNGEFAFTADITGLQSLYEDYKDTLPLCTMSQWGWHTTPVSKDRQEYTLEDLVMSEYDYQGRTVKYPKKKMEGNEEVYDWLRQNPHRLNLARIGFLYQGREIAKEELSDVHQELILYEGKLVSCFKINGISCQVETACDYTTDSLGVLVKSEGLENQDLTVVVEFPYGSPDITASAWEKKDLHETKVVSKAARTLLLERILNKDSYYAGISCVQEVDFDIDSKNHRIEIKAAQNELAVSFDFSEKKKDEASSTAAIFLSSKTGWKKFWEEGGIIRLSKSKDPRAEELERRIILSMYLLAVNSLGSAPPQETGLTCNSWYGKMHLEMYLWHCAWAPLWNHTDLLERSLSWYVKRIKEGEENAKRNGYKGCRWPKMVAGEGIDCPSPVAPLLVWQQPHVIFMLELCYRQKKDKEFLEKYWILIERTADFMADIVAYNEETRRYDIVPPMIPVQECHKHDISKNPVFEVEYWKYTLNLAIEWADRLGKDYPDKWKLVADNMAELPHDESYYLAHENCPDTFLNFNRDHPSMLGALGVIPSNRAEKERMKNTLYKVLECWKYETLWGWDFAVMAMTAARVGLPKIAVDILLLDSPKNNYVASGNNRQILRKDLPLYLPGNGGLLLAAALMAAGYDGCEKEYPGFPDDGMWQVECENIGQYV
jgi:hypothetical protein